MSRCILEREVHGMMIEVDMQKRGRSCIMRRRLLRLIIWTCRWGRIALLIIG